jgi:hypothetical protein
MVTFGPLSKLDLRDEFRAQPLNLLHDLGSDRFTAARTCRLGKIRKRAL